MKIQNNKTRIASTIIASMVIGFVMLSPLTILPDINATSVGNTQKPADIIYIEQHLPKPLSDNELIALKQLSLSNDVVRQSINGKGYAFMGQDFIGDLKKGTLFPEIHINVDNKTEVTVVADLTKNIVISTMTSTIVKLGPQPTLGTASASYATDYYTGSSTIDGLYDEKTAPGIDTTKPNPLVAWLLNAMEPNANPSSACTNGNQFANYFAQVGFQYFNGAQLVWTDTTARCIGQTVSLAYTGGHVYFFEIYVNSNSQWTMLGEDLNTSQFFTRPFPIAVQYNFFSTPNLNTSVFFENQDTSTTWAPYFTSNLLSATDAHYDLSRNGGWNLWNLDAQNLKDCNGNTVTNNVLTGDLKNSDTAQWNMQNMEAYHC